MNYAVIFAGGVGKRMNSKERPKQFLEIHGKPILVHTIEYFEEHKDIDGICIVCVKEWLEYLNRIVSKFNLTKVKWVVPGGETALQSQYKGLMAIYADALDSSKDIVLIHDGVRPLINQTVITECIQSVKLYGSAVIVAPAIETIVTEDVEGYIKETIPRSECVLARAPQCFYLDDIVSVHNSAIQSDNHQFIDSVSMMLSYGHKVHTIVGPSENIKVTTPSDFYICRALLDAREAAQLAD